MGERIDILETVLRAALTAQDSGLGPAETDAIAARLRRWGPELLEGLRVYGGAQRHDGQPLPGPDRVAAQVMDLVAAAVSRRRPALRTLDGARVLQPDWFQLPDQVGYVCYTERFAGTLSEVESKVDYLRELGITYLHLMPLLEPREGPDDGGYAVKDYGRVRPDLGTMDDLAHLADTLHRHHIALTLDLVLNHVAAEHAWAVAARRGEEPYRSYFRLFRDRAEPDAYEATLPEVFPDFAPGSFSWDPDVVWPGEPSRRGAWVWTTFNTFQWDLDWSNPAVFLEMLQVVLDLANVGVDCLRLDAIAFLWKRLGTDCQNQPEVHDLVQALRAAVRIAAPAVIFKAEAIVAPELLPAYLGTGRHAGKVCDLAYHNSLMVQLWSALATGEAVLARRALAVPGPKPVTAAWSTYARCHDDIGWAVSDLDASALGLSGPAHRTFLARFFSGDFPGSFARGEVFQANPATGDARISGTLASLAGLQAALEAGDGRLVDLALGRIFLLHAVLFGYGGIPLIYMGDELGLLNDRSFQDDPRLAGDNRWLHRPFLPWQAAARRHDPTAVEGRVFAGLRHLSRVRARLASLHAAVESEPVDVGNDAVLALTRAHPAGTMLQVYNLSRSWQRVRAHTVLEEYVRAPWEHLSGFAPLADVGGVMLPPYAAWWLADRAAATERDGG